jgi:hypothetical protein
MCIRDVSSSSCGSLEAIAQVGVPKIAVFGHALLRADVHYVVDLLYVLLLENVAKGVE